MDVGAWRLRKQRFCLLQNQCKASKQDCMYMCCILLSGRDLEAGGSWIAADLFHAEYFCSAQMQCAVKREMTGNLLLSGLHNLAASEFSQISMQVDLYIPFTPDILVYS